MKQQWMKKAGFAITVALIGGSAMAQWSTRSNAYGGQTVFGPGGTCIEGRPNPWGGLEFNRIRGNNESLIEDQDIAKRFDEISWLDAGLSRDALLMAKHAWELKGIETALGKQDKKITSKVMFEAAAQIAASQNNEQALKEIVAMAPDCKKYQEELKLAGKTRGALGGGVSMPELVGYIGLNPGEKWIEKISELKPYQQPVFSPELLNAQFRGIPAVKAENVSFLVNKGRMTLDPKLLATGALELAGLKKDIGEALPNSFKPKFILNEAAAMAIDLGDKDSLDFIIGLYKMTPFNDEAKSKALDEQAKLISSTRGSDEYEQDMAFVVGWLIGRSLIYTVTGD